MTEKGGAMEKRIEMSEDVEQGLRKIAEGAGISSNKLAEVLIRAFVEGDGKIFVGRWKEAPGGLRILPDWPRFSSCIIKLRGDEL